MLNPDQDSFCLGASTSQINLPIRINQTNPILIEILRVDFNTGANETIQISAKEAARLKRQADKAHPRNDLVSPRLLHYPVKKTGLYRLQRVTDESNLEVQRRISDTLVVRCPTAMVGTASRNKCRGDLSDFHLQVEATPPLTIKYSKIVNADDFGHAVLSIHPGNLASPLARQSSPGALVPLTSSSTLDVSWAQTQTVQVPLNESLGISGSWDYVIDEVHDGCGNMINYSQIRSHDHGRHKLARGLQLERQFSVHERPVIAFRGCDSQHPVKVAKGRYQNLPIQLSATGSGNLEEAAATLSYLFTRQEDLLPNHGHSTKAFPTEVVIKDSVYGLQVREPGMYSLLSVKTDFCSGDVLEPSSCLLINPPEPDLTINTESIPDRCAGNSVGLFVDLNLVGTPPFQVSYTIRRAGDSITPKVETIDRLHSQLELRPQHAGRYTYEFTTIVDSVYHDPMSLAHKNLVLEQDVKPPAAARIFDADVVRKACIDEPVEFAVQMMGQPPYSLDLELIHRGRRVKETVPQIESNMYLHKTDPLKDGGEHTLALTGITDQSGCKVSLKAEAKVDVGLQRPRVAFGYVEGKRNILALEGSKVKIPLRMQGEAPWTFVYRNLDDDQARQLSIDNDNDYLQVASEGTYELVDVHDASCPGNVEKTANQFAVHWIPRPSVHMVESPLIRYERDRYVKNEVCEGDEDGTEVSFRGTPPFDFVYEQRFKPERGSQSVSPKNPSAGLTSYSITMDTHQAGLYEYRLVKLGDISYKHDAGRFSPLVIQQRVYPRPSASFTRAGNTYRYCKEEEAGGETIPITLTGLPPFQLELELKHHVSTKPELINIPNVDSNNYNLHIPHKLLALGTHSVTIRKVRDSRGCQRRMDSHPPNVQVSVAEIPSISPLEDQTDYCVGDRISYALSGTPPFNVYYTFQGLERKASVPTTDFRRIAERAGSFIITAISDHRSTDACKAKTRIGKEIHEMPSVRVSKGRTATVDIHQGGEAAILFEFGGTPPFHFT